MGLTAQASLFNGPWVFTDKPTEIHLRRLKGLGFRVKANHEAKGCVSGRILGKP